MTQRIDQQAADDRARESGYRSPHREPGKGGWAAGRIGAFTDHLLDRQHGQRRTAADQCGGDQQWRQIGRRI